MSSQSAQSLPLRKGDSFVLLTPAAEGHPLQHMDAIVLENLATRTGATPNGNKWLVEYSYAVRPAKITIKAGSQEQSLDTPKSAALLVCGDTSHRVTVRVMAKDDGTQSYRGSAELVECRSDLDMDEILFDQLLNSSLGSLKIE